MYHYCEKTSEQLLFVQAQHMIATVPPILQLGLYAAQLDFTYCIDVVS